MAIRTFNSVGGFSVGETTTTIILANGDITTANATLSANVAALRVLTDNLLYANGIAWDFQEAAGSGNYQIQYNLNNNFSASANFIFDPTVSLLTVTGNANVTGNINVGTLNGNFAGNIIGNITAPGSNTYIQFNDGGNSNAVAEFTFNKSTNAVSISGNVNAANANLGNLTTSNYYSGTLTTAAQPNITSLGTLTGLSMSGGAILSGGNLLSANYLTGTLTTAAQPNITSVGTLDNLSVTSNITTGNLTGANLISGNYVAGTLTTAAQPNITSTGTLSSLNVTGNANVDGNVNAGNLYVANRVTTTLLPGGDNTLNLGNSSLKWSNLYVSNILIGTTYIQSTSNVIMMDAANTANNMSAGSLTVRGDATMQGNATISGNLTVSGNTTYINVTNLSINDPLIEMGGTANGGNATAYDGLDRGLILHNYKSDSSGPINEAFIWKTGNGQFEAFSNVLYTGEVIDGANSTYGNIKAEKFIGNLSGTILTNSQTNITAVGTLGNLSVTSNITAANANITSTFKASGLTYPTTDGTTSQVLSTYGNGSLYWATISTSSLSNGNSNITVLNNGNVTISSNGVSNIVNIDGVSADPTVRITGNANISGTINAGNTTVANLLIGNSTVRSNTVTTTSTSTDQTIVTFPYANLRGAIFDVKGEQAGGGKYSIATVSCVHNGTAVDYSVYGTVTLGGATGTLAVNLVGSNLFLTVTPASSNSTVWTTQYRTI
jgi:hypothetical protein